MFSRGARKEGRGYFALDEEFSIITREMFTTSVFTHVSLNQSHHGGRWPAVSLINKDLTQNGRMERSGSIGLTNKKSILKVWKNEDQEKCIPFSCWEITFIAID